MKFEFSIDNREKDEIFFEVLDKDPLKSDLIGHGTLEVAKVSEKGGTNGWFDIKFKGTSAGKVHMDI